MMVAPYCHARLSSVASVKSIRDMSDEEINWAIADAEGSVTPRWQPHVFRGGKMGR
jgi:hypothetical protein